MPSPSLPFVIAPKRKTRIVSAEVNGEICTIEFPVFGALRSGELIDIKEHEYQSAVYRESSHLADALVADGTDEVEAQRIAIRILSTRMGVPVALDAPEQRAMLHHADLIAGLQDSLNDEFIDLNLRTVTALISRRLPGCEEWTAADTETLPGTLQDAIAAFADEEKAANGKAKTVEELVNEMADTLGKLAPPASADPGSPKPVTTQTALIDSCPDPLIGAASSGAADDSGPMHQSSDPSNSQP